MLKRIALAAVTAALSLSAHADGNGQITAYYVSPGSSIDTRMCVFFQTNGGSQWYAVPKSDPMFDSEQKLLEGAAFTGYAVNFGIGPSGSCGLPVAGPIYHGRRLRLIPASSS